MLAQIGKQNVSGKKRVCVVSTVRSIFVIPISKRVLKATIFSGGPEYTNIDREIYIYILYIKISICIYKYLYILFTYIYIFIYVKVVFYIYTYIHIYIYT